MVILQNVALPRNSLFSTFQTRPTRPIKGWKARWSTSHLTIFMLDKGKDNGIQENSTMNRNSLDMKQNPSESLGSFYKGCDLGDGPHAPDREFLDVLSTEPFACDNDLTKQPTSNKKGTLIGAISLITGTCIGSGILALPASTAPAGFIPSAVSMVICWGFLVLEALILAEVNVTLLRQQDPSHSKNCESEVISLRTMAEKTLGNWGGNVSTISYIFLSYTIMVAYITKSGEILSFIFHIPASIAGALFTCIFGILLLVGGTKVTDKVNQLLTACLMGLFLFIVAVTPFLGGWSGINHMDWDPVPQTIPVIVFSLVYHDLIPVLCAYLGGDMSRIRTSIIFGSIVPLASYLIWDAVALGVAPISGGEDPLDFLLRFGGNDVSYIVQVFSLLAIATSLIGTLLGFLEFFLEQISDSKIIAVLRGNIWTIPVYMIYPKVKYFITLLHPFKETISHLAYRGSIGRSFPSTMVRASKMASFINRWWISNGFRLAAFSLVIFPPLMVSNFVGNAFFTATDIARLHQSGHTHRLKI